MIESSLERIRRHVAARTDEQIRFLTTLCDQNSFTMNKGGTDRVAEMILSRLDGCFDHHRIVHNNEIGDHHVLTTAGDGEHVVLVGHMDTVFPPEHPFQRCARKGERLYGPGTADMKGGLAVFVYALLALKHTETSDGLPLTLILNADEEIGSPTSRPLFEEARRCAAACLVGECAGLHSEFVVSRNGKMGIRITSKGEDRHVGSGTHKKASAVLELAHKIVQIEGLNGFLPGVSVNVGRIEGGLGPATIPAEAECFVDVRWVDSAHRQILESEIEQIVSHASQKDCTSRWEILNERPAMVSTVGTTALFDAAKDTAAELGQKLNSEHRRGTSDANFFGSAGVPTLDGWGPVGGRDHTPEEYILLPSLKERTVLMAFFLSVYSRRMKRAAKPGSNGMEASK